MTTDVMICRARLLAACSDTVGSELVDVELRRGRIASVSPHAGVRPGSIDADGAVLMPGLWDAHVHFSTHALLAECLQLPADAPIEEVLSRVGIELATRSGDGVLVGFGFRSATWPDEPSLSILDTLSREPIALIAGDLHSLWCNTAGLAAVGIPGHPTGLLREEDAFAAMVHLMRTETSHIDALVRDAGRRVAAMGVVGIIDMEMQWGIGTWLRRLESGRSQIRVDVATYSENLDRLIGLGFRTGTALGDRLRVGPLKIISDGSLSSRTAHCLSPYPNPIEGSPQGVANHSPQEMVALLTLAARHGIHGAVHAIGDLACRDALDAFELSGACGSIEHAQLIHPDDLPRFARLDVTASVQPAHLLEDEALLDAVWPTSTDRAFPLRALVDAGAHLRLGSDAPVSPLDPWLAMDVAVHKPHRPGQGLSPVEALAASTRTRVAVGQPADLVLLDRSPAQLEGGHFTTTKSLLTMIAGEPTHGHADMVDE